MTDADPLFQDTPEGSRSDLQETPAGSKTDLATLANRSDDGGQEQKSSFTRKHLRGKKQPTKKYLQCLNLRDVGATVPDSMRPGMVFRSSQLMRCASF